MPAFFEQERPEVARRPRPPPRHPGAVRPGHHRLALPPPAGPGELAHAITRSARRHSIFVGYNGGHVLPAVLPPGVDVTSDPCSRAAGRRRLRAPLAPVLRRAAQGPRHRAARLRPLPPGHARQHLHDRPLGRAGHRRSTSARSPPPRPAAPRSPSRSPRARSGSPARRTSPATLTALGANNRAFYGLAVGTSPADAHLVQNNVLPINELAPVTGEHAADRAAVRRGGRARGPDALRAREPGERHVRRDGQPYAGGRRTRQHGGPPPRRGAEQSLNLSGMRARAPLSAAFLACALAVAAPALAGAVPPPSPTGRPARAAGPPGAGGHGSRRRSTPASTTPSHSSDGERGRGRAASSRRTPGSPRPPTT